MPSKQLLPRPALEILTYEEIIRVIHTAVSLGINKIRITGGEPFVRKGALQLIESLIQIKGITDLSITTNGTFLAGVAKELRKLQLTRINIGLDSLDRDKYKFITGGGNLGDVLNGIEQVLYLGFNPVKINVVVIKGINDDEIPDFVKFALAKPLQVRFIEFMPIVDFWQEERFISEAEIKKKIGKSATNKISFISPVTKPFCQKCSRLRLTADGNLIPCLGGREKTDIKPILRNSQYTDEDLKNTFVSIAKSKPMGHRFGEKIYSFPEVSMSRIGG
jgi:cyclic pyranopterin phosphate synthase